MHQCQQGLLPRYEDVPHQAPPIEGNLQAEQVLGYWMRTHQIPSTTIDEFLSTVLPVVIVDTLEHISQKLGLRAAELINSVGDHCLRFANYTAKDLFKSLAKDTPIVQEQRMTIEGKNGIGSVELPYYPLMEHLHVFFQNPTLANAVISHTTYNGQCYSDFSSGSFFSELLDSTFLEDEDVLVAIELNWDDMSVTHTTPVGPLYARISNLRAPHKNDVRNFFVLTTVPKAVDINNVLTQMIENEFDPLYEGVPIFHGGRQKVTGSDPLLLAKVKRYTSVRNITAHLSQVATASAETFVFVSDLDHHTCIIQQEQTFLLNSFWSLSATFANTKK